MSTSATATSHRLPWRTRADVALERAKLAVAHKLGGLIEFGTTREEGVAACAAWAFRTVRRLLQRLASWRRDEPRTAQDMLALARSVERESPSLAAELRCIAMHRPDAAK